MAKLVDGYMVHHKRNLDPWPDAERNIYSLKVRSWVNLEDVIHMMVNSPEYVDRDDYIIVCPILKEVQVDDTE